MFEVNGIGKCSSFATPSIVVTLRFIYLSLIHKSNGMGTCLAFVLLREFLSKRVVDGVIRKLIDKWLNEGVMSLTGQQISWLLDGYDLAAMRGHKTLHYESVF